MTTEPSTSDLALSRALFLKNLLKLGRQAQTFNADIILDVFKGVRMDESGKSSAFLAFEELSNLSQDMVLEAKRLFGSAPNMVSHFEKVSMFVTHGTALFSAISAFALQLESPAYTEVSHWLVPWFKDDHTEQVGRLSGGERFDLYDVAHMAIRLKQVFGQAMNNRTPEMFADEQFRGIRVQNRLFALTMHNQLLKIIEESRASEERSSYWVSKIKEVETNDPGGWPILRAELASKLLTYDLQGLAGLRLQTLGYNSPKGAECTNRVEGLVRNAVLGIQDTDIQTQSTVISGNKLYRQDVLVDDLIETLDDFKRHYNDNDKGDSFYGGEQTTKLLSEIFQKFELTTDELSNIGLRSAASLNRGQVRELLQKPLLDRLKVMMDVFVDQFVMNHSELNFHVLCAVVKNLPENIASKLASYSDETRASIYKITGSAKYLTGIKNSAVIDDLMARDLGI
ncbi:hypothetical protein [Pseudomonas amygdali]|uniref:Uncharacterized protein n=2 Tax=Pseudomonas amygdali pv. lachrymans TaxID=53707 RepID=A0ABR5KRC3_PSEAV|nr:hypothetical protein [Pseudomonas amygdali]AXH59643.1 hypothetical protein PLA107_030940 [Pseudomonas amygdali pv. lachrymans str. M301315]KPC17071.1 Uncharacterized protein AC499_0273 [Pseudomonas amygdali pv. lachrymans]KPC18030.1 Uncharacterized protein AC499_1232 [Pseudomonas amygdali pv. lachrymans]RMT06540.1 hypothetical protein ALP54_03558 [Pseudomonas amygdali pv. lachrymans]